MHDHIILNFLKVKGWAQNKLELCIPNFVSDAKKPGLSVEKWPEGHITFLKAGREYRAPRFPNSIRSGARSSWETLENPGIRRRQPGPGVLPAAGAAGRVRFPRRVRELEHRRPNARPRGCSGTEAPLSLLVYRLTGKGFSSMPWGLSKGQKVAALWPSWISGAKHIPKGALFGPLRHLASTLIYSSHIMLGREIIFHTFNLLGMKKIPFKLILHHRQTRNSQVKKVISTNDTICKNLHFLGKFLF